MSVENLLKKLELLDFLKSNTGGKYQSFFLSLLCLDLYKSLLKIPANDNSSTKYFIIILSILMKK